MLTKKWRQFCLSINELIATKTKENMSNFVVIIVPAGGLVYSW